MAGDCKSSDFSHSRFDPYHFHQNVPTHNRIVCVRTMRSEIMTHRTLPLGREGRWQHESSPWSGSGWKVLLKAMQSWRHYNYRRREEAPYIASIAQLVRAVDS